MQVDMLSQVDIGKASLSEQLEKFIIPTLLPRIPLYRTVRESLHCPVLISFADSVTLSLSITASCLAPFSITTTRTIMPVLYQDNKSYCHKDDHKDILSEMYLAFAQFLKDTTVARCQFFVGSNCGSKMSIVHLHLPCNLPFGLHEEVLFQVGGCYTTIDDTHLHPDSPLAFNYCPCFLQSKFLGVLHENDAFYFASIADKGGGGLLDNMVFP